MAGPKVVSSKPISVVSSKPIKEPSFEVEREAKPSLFSRIINPNANPKDEHGNPLNIDEEGRKIETVSPSVFNEFTALASKIPFDKARNFLTDKIALSNYIPEKVKPYAASAASLITEVPRFALESPPFPKGLPKPESILESKAVQEAPKFEYKPGVIPKKPQLALPASGETTRTTPRFIAGEQGVVDADNVPKYDLGPTKEFQREATIMPHEFGEQTNVTPDIPANYGTGLGRPSSILPENTRSTGAPVVDDLVPNRYKTVPDTKIYNEGTVTRVPTRPQIVKQTPVPDAEIQATKQAKADRAMRNWKPEDVKKVALDPSIPPEIRKGVVAIAKEDATKLPSNFLTSIYKQLTSIGGEELVNRAQRAVHAIRRLDNEHVRPYINALKRVSKDDRALMGQYVEGKLVAPTPEVQNAVNTWKEAQIKLSTEAEKAGIRLYDGDKFENFKAEPGDYWPHIPNEKKTDFIDKLVASGKTVKEAQDILANIRKNGELVSGFQNIRKNATFDYNNSADVGVAHLRGLAKRIAQHTEFGPLDITGKGNEGIFDLIHATKDEKLANTLMQRIIGRDEFSVPKLNQYLSTAKKWQSITKLMNFSIPNVALGQMANTFKASSHPIEVAKELKNLFSKTYRDELRSAGIYEDVAYSLGEEFENYKHISSITNDPFAIGAGEKINRMVAAAVGKAVARGHFNAIKSGNIGYKNEFGKELSSLVSDNLDKIMKQDKLTPEQLQQAAGRMAEITQGLSVPGNLPHGWSTPVKDTEQLGKQMMLIFKKVGFQNTKMLWDGVKANPQRNVPILLGLSQVTGTLVGGSKSAIKGAWTGKPKKEWEKRDDWVGKIIGKDELRTVSRNTGIPEWVITRGLDNVAQSFMLGLPADLFNSASTGPTGLASALGGPVVGDVSELAYDVSQIGKDKGQKLGRKVLSSLPIPGSRGLADRLLPNK